MISKDGILNLDKFFRIKFKNVLNENDHHHWEELDFHLIDKVQLAVWDFHFIRMLKAVWFNKIFFYYFVIKFKLANSNEAISEEPVDCENQDKDVNHEEIEDVKQKKIDNSPTEDDDMIFGYLTFSTNYDDITKRYIESNENCINNFLKIVFFYKINCAFGQSEWFTSEGKKEVLWYDN